MFHERFPETTGLRYIGEIYQSLDYGLAAQDQRGAPPPDAVEPLARARALREVLERTIRRSWFCMQGISEPGMVPKAPDLLAVLSRTLTDTPEKMRMNGLFLLLAVGAPVDDAVFREMALRYFRSPRHALPRPESIEQCPLLYPATRGMERLQELRKAAQAYQAQPESHDEFPQKLRQAVPEIFAAIYAIQHYLASGDTGDRQAQGLRALDRELQILEEAGRETRVSPQTQRTFGEVLGEIRATLPVQETDSSLYLKLSRDILRKQAPEPVSRVQRDGVENANAHEAAPPPPRKPGGPRR